MKAIILAGGAGTRLGGIVRDVPKPMAPVAGKPFLEYLVLQLVRQGFSNVIISIGYMGDVIKSYFGNGDRWDAQIAYSEEDEPLGTGGALREAIKTTEGEQFIVMNGDSFLDVDFNELIACHRSSQAMISMALAYVDDITRYGLVEVEGGGKVVGFCEKGAGGRGIINGGVYACRREIVDSIPAGKVSLENDVFPALINNGLYGFELNGCFVDIGVPGDYLGLCEDPRKVLDGIGL